MVVSDTYDNANAIRASTIKIEEFQKFMEAVQCEKLSDADARKLVRNAMKLGENDPCNIVSYGGFCTIMVS